MILRTIVMGLGGLLAGCASVTAPEAGSGTSEQAPERVVEEPAPAESPWSASVETERGTYRIAWRPLGSEVPKNEYFELEVEVTKQGELFRDGRLVVDAQMPDHGHGMNVSPRAFMKKDGRWRVKGMVLHMGGRWVLELGVLTVGAAEKAYFEIQLP